MNLIRKINIKLAINTMMLLLSCTIVFHLLVLSQIIPFDIVWGGRLETASQMYTFEAISLTINIALIIVIAVKGNYLKPIINPKVVRVVLWALTVLFALNTLGNILSLSTLEAILFTPITAISAIFCCRMAIEP